MAIPLASNFNVGVALPIDSRMVVENDAALNTILNQYLGMVAFSSQSQTLFYLKDVDTWVPLGSGIGGGGGAQSNIFEAGSGVYFSGLKITFDKTSEVIFEGNTYINKINNQTSFGVYNYYIDKNSNLPINLQLSGLPLGIRTGNLVNLFYKDLNTDGTLVYQPTIMELYTGGSEEDLFPIVNHPYYEDYDGKIPVLRKIKNATELDLQYKEIYNTYTFTGQQSFENLDLRNEFLIKNSVYNLNFEVGENNSNYSIYLPDPKSGIDYSSRNFFNIDAIENVDDLNFQDFQQKLRSVNLSFYAYEYTGNGNYGNTLNLIYEKNSIDYDDKIEFIFEEFGWKLRNSYLANSVKQHSHEINQINDLPQYLDRIDFTKEIEKKYIHTESEQPFLFEIFEPSLSGLYFGNKVSSNSDGSVILIAETGRSRVSIYTGSQLFGWNFKQTLGPSIGSIEIGLSVSLNSDASTIFVGARVNSLGTPLRGRMLIYTGSAEGGWLIKEGILDLLDSNPSYLSSSLGFSSACNHDGSLLYVGMPTSSISGITGGAVNIYTGSQDRSYVRVKTISGESLQNNRFGENLSTNFWGDTVLISSLGNNNTGLISIYTGDNENWGLKQTLTGGRLSSNNYDASVLYIGYPNFGNITNDAGKVSIYTGNRFDGWALTQSITGGSGDKFGSSLANNADGSILFIGGIGNTTGLVNGFTSTGAVWAYTGYNLDQWGLAYRVKESGTKAFGNSIATDYDGTLLLSADQLGDLTGLGYNASGTGVVYSYNNLSFVSTVAQSLDFKVPITINGQPLSGGVGANVVYTTGNQTISGIKTFVNPIGIGFNPETSISGAGEDGQSLRINARQINLSRGYAGPGLGFTQSEEITLHASDLHLSARTVADSLYVGTSYGQVYPEKFYVIGNSKFEGTASFDTRPTVNGVGVLLSGEVISNSSNSYVIANPGDDLLSKYQLAKSLNPNGTSKNEINRSSLILNPGVYNLTGHWNIGEEFVDIIGVGAIKKDVGCIPAVIITGSGSAPGSGFVHVSANDVKIKGIYFSGNFDRFFNLGNALPKQVFEDCKGNNYSFVFVRPFGFTDTIFIDGTFINCEGGDDSFECINASHSSNATIINCKAGENSFFSFSTLDINGIYKNCQGGNRCFGAGGLGANLRGTFENCQVGDSSFGFGAFPDLYGKFKNCTASIQSFGHGGGSSFSGSFFENCTAGGSGFGFNTSSLSGATFVNCTAGPFSWGGIGVGDNNRMLGKLYQCRLTSGTFGISSGEGLLRNCIDGDNNIIDG